MPLTFGEMRAYLSRSLSSVNRNKLNGVLAEIAFRAYVSSLGYESRVSEGGWIVRSAKRGDFSFAQNTVVFFPEILQAGQVYNSDRRLPEPRRGLHTICATFHQIGIRSFFCAGTMAEGSSDVTWHAIQLGVPDIQQYAAFPECVSGFNPRRTRYNFLRYDTDASTIPEEALPVEFSKESLRIAFSNSFLAEISDVDGLFWGQEKTYPLEIKEKTRAKDSSVGDYFGLDVGPFVKLAFYAAKRGNLHSMFVVREIDNEEDRNLVAWRYITFDDLAQFASWVFIRGGRGMTGGTSATVKIPAERFRMLDRASLGTL